MLRGRVVQGGRLLAGCACPATSRELILAPTGPRWPFDPAPAICLGLQVLVDFVNWSYGVSAPR